MSPELPSPFRNPDGTIVETIPLPWVEPKRPRVVGPQRGPAGPHGPAVPYPPAYDHHFAATPEGQAIGQNIFDFVGRLMRTWLRGAEAFFCGAVITLDRATIEYANIPEGTLPDTMHVIIPWTWRTYEIPDWIAVIAAFAEKDCQEEMENNVKHLEEIKKDVIGTWTKPFKSADPPDSPRVPATPPSMRAAPRPRQ